MNKTKTPTVDKVTFPLRLPPKLYKQIRAKVNEIKETENYAYSIICTFLMMSNTMSMKLFRDGKGEVNIAINQDKLPESLDNIDDFTTWIDSYIYKLNGCFAKRRSNVGDII